MRFRRFSLGASALAAAGISFGALAADMASPPNSLVVSDTGEVGVGTAVPTAPLHITRADGTSKVLVHETNAAVVDRTLFELKAAGTTKFLIDSTNAGVKWAFTNSGTDFRISRQGSGVVELKLDNTGDMTIQGNLTQLSSRASKGDIQAVDPRTILAKVVTLPIAEWRYARDPNVPHIGPMSEDFAAAFGLGDNPQGIAAVDADGVALAAIQGLNQMLVERDGELAALQHELAELKQLVNTLAASSRDKGGTPAP